MMALIMGAVKALAVLSLITLMVALTGCLTWRLIYYGWGCRRNPVGKTIMLTAVFLWLVSAAIINLV